MNLLQIASVLIVLAGAFGAVNHLYLRLPSAIGILVVALLSSFFVMGLNVVWPDLQVDQAIRGMIQQVDFSEALLEGMLGLLLFAGALNVKVADLREQVWGVVLMATVGVAISTAIVGFGFSWLMGVPLVVALVFGALISPTDPVAVLGALREADLPKSLETKIAGESLFNDGVAYAVFLILVGVALPQTGVEVHGVGGALMLFVREAFGGAALGVGLGWMTFRVMRRIDDYPLEILITLGLAFGGYVLADALDVSAPIMAVCAGLFIGDVGARFGMTEDTRANVGAFWQMVDEILNAILFLMIGFEVFAIAFSLDTFVAGALAVVLSLVARFVSVAIPITLLRPFNDRTPGTIPIMTWGGLKGGVSVALALSLPDSDWKPLVLTATYIVVVFSIVVQGLTVSRLANKVGREPDLV